MLTPLLPIVYKDQLKLKKTEEAEHVLLQNNGKDVRLSENKLSHECETPKSKVSSIKDKFKGFG
jgi:hypothetical protein